MANIKVSAGLNRKLTLPDAQVVFIGRHKLIKSLTFDESVGEKLQGVDAKLFEAAINYVKPDSSISIYLDLAKVIAIADSTSRTNAPSNSYSIFKELKGLKVAPTVKVNDCEDVYILILIIFRRLVL